MPLACLLPAAGPLERRRAMLAGDLATLLSATLAEMAL
jgi:hypothetical protein